jgi:hypothetical protein
MNYKLLATKFGESLKYSSSYNEVGRVFQALVEFPFVPHDNPSITSIRSITTYGWVMTIAESNLDEAEKREIIRQAIEALIIEDNIKQQLLKLMPNNETESVPKSSSSEYVNKSRIEELSKQNSSNFDLCRLLQICRELNLANQTKQFLTIALLTRALLDHVPPIFNCKNFDEIANNYSGTKSFKESMQHLQNSSRKIADSYLHTQIRNKEVLPNFTQVDFTNDLDVLLGEIVRILK